MPRRASAAGCYIVFALLALTIGCRDKAPIEPLKLDGGMLTVDNRSSNDWTGVEIWLNRNHSVRVASIPAGARQQVPLEIGRASCRERV